MSKIGKNKKFMLIASVCFSAMISATFMNTGNAVVYASNNSELIKSVTGELYGTPEVLQNDSLYEDMFEEELITYQDDNYIYLFNDQGTNIEAVILADMPEEPLYSTISSSKQAEDTATEIVSKAYPDFFDYEYEITSREAGEENKTYTVELKEKYDDNFYTGNKVAVIITSDGYLDSMVSRITEQPNSTRDQKVELIDENTALDNAYDALEAVVQSLETKENRFNLANTKANDSAIVSDAGLLGVTEMEKDVKTVETQPYEIMLEDKEGQAVDTYKEVNNGVVEWVVNISNVATNRFWGDINFIVNINANTGDVDSVTYTR
jgi:hypothetical protein